MKFLLPVDSRVRDTQGFCVLDTITGVVDYTHTDERYPYRRKGFRGACTVGERVFVCNSFSVKAFEFDVVDSGLTLIPVWQLQLPEWLVGRAANADLHALHLDSVRGVLLLANSFMDSVDTISLDGEFLGREFLWEISGQVRSLVVNRNSAAPDLCHLNHIAQAFGQTFLTLGNINATGQGAVLHKESGAFVVEGLERPHDGVFWRDEFWITETAANQLRVYRGINSAESFRNCKAEIVDLSTHINEDEKFWCRGLHVTEERIYVGCSQFQDRVNNVAGMPPSHVLELDKQSGRVIARFAILGSKEMERPVLFSLLPLVES
ncbi:hypothetical protein [uncultured Gilvimarinus sp.]|uniref:hypothetical protein n=1 Tax=uncultured Gilvimarinus sp. TaxID=1689143 RepID=UPI0030EC8BA9|tara:strand:- start:4100 stop:5062 length:963 start_codon:yes stop_codon:yes gene_type:complete